MIPPLRTIRPLPNRVRTFPSEEVTTRNPNEAPAPSAGLRQKDVEDIWKAVVGNSGILGEAQVMRNQPEDSVLTPLTAEGFVQVGG